MRIAMWSGPRNVSTAMMYSFAARGDFAVRDEPFYAPYLLETGLVHPMTDEIMSAHECNAQTVADACAGEIEAGKPNLYLKLMTHHMLPGFPLDWARSYLHVHLIRHPARVVASYAAKRGELTLSDLGYLRQVEIYETYGGLVVDSDDVRANPKGTLTRLCAEIGLEFSESMLNWPAGPRPEDGVWARHWYGAVHSSTGFAAPDGPLPDVDDAHSELVSEAIDLYAHLWRHKL